MTTNKPHIIDVDYTNDKMFLENVAHILQGYFYSKTLSPEEENQLAALIYLCGYSIYTIQYGDSEEPKYVDVLDGGRLLEYCNYIHYRLNNEILMKMSSRYYQTKLSALLLKRELKHPLISYEAAERSRMIWNRRGRFGNYIDDIEFITAISSVFSKYGKDTDMNMAVRKDAYESVNIAIHMAFSEIYECVEVNPDYDLTFTRAGDDLIRDILRVSKWLNPLCFCMMRYLIACRQDDKPLISTESYIMSSYRCKDDFDFIRRVECLIHQYRMKQFDKFPREEKFVLNHFTYIFGLIELYMIQMEKEGMDIQFTLHERNIGAYIIHFKLREFLEKFKSDKEIYTALKKLCIVREKTVALLSPENIAAKTVTIARNLPESVVYQNDFSFFDTVERLCLSKQVGINDGITSDNPETLITESLLLVVRTCRENLYHFCQEEGDSKNKHSSYGDIVQTYFENYNLLLPFSLYCALYICALRRRIDLVKEVKPEVICLPPSCTEKEQQPPVKEVYVYFPMNKRRKLIMCEEEDHKDNEQGEKNRGLLTRRFTRKDRRRRGSKYSYYGKENKRETG